MWQEFVDKFTLNFVVKDRWMYLRDGLAVTLIITFFALILGLFIGFTVAMIRSYHKNTGKLKLLDRICQVYLTVIRGTPVIVQLLIIYYAIFTNGANALFVAVLTFGINSGAYQAEIFRSGIDSVPKGQLEAGRSLGFNFGQTMRLIILPQAIKNILPTLGNEFISLLKETSVAGYITLQDLTKGGDIIRTRTYSPFMPYLAVALIYLSIVMLISQGIKLLERRMKQSDAR